MALAMLNVVYGIDLTQGSELYNKIEEICPRMFEIEIQHDYNGNGPDPYWIGHQITLTYAHEIKPEDLVVTEEHKKLYQQDLDNIIATILHDDWSDLPNQAELIRLLLEAQPKLLILEGTS
jgi:hypothetical protein